MADPGQIVILNGASRSGKSTIARVMQDTLPDVWMHIGMDAHIAMTPPALRPGVGLRPGRNQVDPHVEDQVPVLYAALYESVAAHARLGLNVVMDVKHHDGAYSKPRRILPDCAARLDGLCVLFVGVRCPIDVIWERREATWGQVRGEVDDGVTAAVELSQHAVHAHGDYDLEVDTSVLSPAECAEVIRHRLGGGPPGTAFAKLADASGRHASMP